MKGLLQEIDKQIEMVKEHESGRLDGECCLSVLEHIRDKVVLSIIEDVVEDFQCTDKPLADLKFSEDMVKDDLYIIIDGYKHEII